MGEEIASENGRISNFQGLVTLTLDRVILHTAVHHSSTSSCIPNFIEIKETFCRRTDGHMRPTLLGLLGGVDLKSWQTKLIVKVTNCWQQTCEWFFCRQDSYCYCNEPTTYKSLETVTRTWWMITNMEKQFYSQKVPESHLVTQLSCWCMWSTWKTKWIMQL